MKLITQFENKYNKITYRLYELDCGIKFIHLQNPSSINFDFASAHKAGNIYEEMDQIPHGTAHLMEHIIFTPNTKFKTKDDIHKFQEGNKTRPSLYINGFTGYKYIVLVASSNKKGTDRVLERMDSLIDFPFAKFKKNLVNEKKIVTAERSRRPKIEKDNFIQRLIFLEGKEVPEFKYQRIGEVGEIDNIDVKDLQKYFINRFINKNVVFAIQSSTLPSKILINKLENLGQKYSNNKAPNFRNVLLENKLDYGHYFDEKATGTSLELNYFDKVSKEINYRNEAIEDVLSSIIKKIGHDLLREEKGLIYGLEAYNDDWYSINHYVKCFKFVVENSRVAEMLENLDKFLLEDIKKFIKSEKGTRWINNIVSNYIYPNTIVYNRDLPYDIAIDYSEYGQLYNYNLYVEEIKKITKKDLLQKLTELQTIPPHIWTESNLPEKELEKIVKESSLWKRFK